MLHSTLPRAFLTPGLKYLSSYYGDDVTPYQTTTSYPATQFEEHYPRIPEHHVFPTWHTVQRSASPCPLDLSLKPSKSEKDIQEDPKLQEDGERDHQRIRGYVLDVEEDRDQNEIIGDRNRGEDERRQIILHDEGEEKVEVDRDNVRIGIYPDEDVRLHSPRYQKIPVQNTAASLHLQSTVQAYHHQQLLMTPQHHLQGINAPMTPPSTPSPPQCPRKRQRDESGSSSTGLQGTASPSGNNSSRHSTPGAEKPVRPKKKHARRLKFDEDTSSPVSGTVILGPDEAVVTGDIDPAFNVVEVTEEARAELAKIENRLGPYQCRLCRQLHDDAFQLAQHRCSRIAHVEYRCPECDKRFSCPANLASHRRWHKPRVPAGENTTSSSVGATGQTTLATNTNEFSCTRCDAKFSRQAALRKHVANQHSEMINSGNVNANGNGNNVRSNSTESNTSGSCSLVAGNVEQVSNHAGNHLGISTLAVEMP